MNTKLFQKTQEDFTCEHCGNEVEGNGYTNHCPRCLWSKHVDIHPGDRAEECRDLMEPVSFQKLGEKYLILHRCKKCGFERRNSFSSGDNFDILLGLSGRA